MLQCQIFCVRYIAFLVYSVVAAVSSVFVAVLFVNCFVEFSSSNFIDVLVVGAFNCAHHVTVFI